MAARVTEAKVASHNIKALITPLVEGKREPEALIIKRVDQQDLTFPY